MCLHFWCSSSAPWRQCCPWCRNSIAHKCILHNILCGTSLLGFSQAKLCNLLIWGSSAGVNCKSVKILYCLILFLFNTIPYDADGIWLQRCLECSRDGWTLFPKKKWSGLYSGRGVLISVQLFSTCSLEGRCSIHPHSFLPSLASVGQLVPAEDHQERAGILQFRHVAAVSSTSSIIGK